MPTSVIIPTLGKPKTVKDAVISILSTEWPLTTRKIYSKVKNMDLDVSYQAIYKALNEFVTESIVKKTGSEYQLNEDWIEKIKEFGNELESLYKGKETESLEKVINIGYQSFSFETVFDLYKFILDALVFFQNYYRHQQPKNPGIVHFSHMWWALVGSVREQENFKKAASWDGGVYLICSGNTYADKLLAKFYTGVKGADIKIKLDTNCANDYETFIVEDCLIQVYLSNKIKRVFESTYKNFKHGSSSSFGKFYEDILFKKTEINVIINKNPRVAELIRNKTLKHFNYNIKC